MHFINKSTQLKIKGNTLYTIEIKGKTLKQAIRMCFVVCVCNKRVWYTWVYVRVCKSSANRGPRKQTRAGDSVRYLRSITFVSL